MNDSTTSKHLKTLGFSQETDPHSITEKNLKNVYRKLSNKYHPDKYPDASEKEKPSLDQKMKDIIAAYKFLKIKTIKSNAENYPQTLNCRIFFSGSHDSAKRKLNVSNYLNSEFSISCHFSNSNNDISRAYMRDDIGKLNFKRDPNEIHWKKNGYRNYFIFLKEVANYLENDFLKKHQLNETEYQKFVYYLSDFSPFIGYFGTEVPASATLQNGKISFSDDDKKKFEENLSIHLDNFRDKQAKVTRNTAAITALLGAAMVCNSAITEPPPQPNLYVDNVTQHQSEIINKKTPQK